MKQTIMYASAIGITIGFIVYLAKKNKWKISINQQRNDEINDRGQKHSEREALHNTDIIEEMVNTKEASACSIHDRHTEAENLMRNAFENIYKDIGEVELDTKDDLDIIEPVVVNDKLNSISNELDDLLN